MSATTSMTRARGSWSGSSSATAAWTGWTTNPVRSCCYVDKAGVVAHRSGNGRPPPAFPAILRRLLLCVLQGHARCGRRDPGSGRVRGRCAGEGGTICRAWSVYMCQDDVETWQRLCAGVGTKIVLISTTLHMPLPQARVGPAPPALEGRAGQERLQRPCPGGEAPRDRQAEPDPLRGWLRPAHHPQHRHGAHL